MIIFYFILSLVGAFVLAGIIFGFFLSAPVYKGPVSDHFDGKKFINPGGVQAKGLRELPKWLAGRNERIPWTSRMSIPPGKKPVEKNEDGVRVTFVNHSTFLLQMEGLNILTDPVWSERVSPFSFAGPKRMRPPGIRLEDLPHIDVVLLSHNHYDHLDIATVRTIHGAHHPLFIVPLGVGSFLQQNGIVRFTELDWWSGTTFQSLHIDAVPAQHFSGRGTFDRDATLWCGYMIKCKSDHIYFAGDSGYNPNTFVEIGQRFSPISLSLIPIGAFKPKWFMSPIHCCPEEAVQIHLDVKSHQTVATHFGTFPLADDGPEEPLNDLKKGLQEKGVNESKFLVLEEGDGRNFELGKV